MHLRLAAAHDVLRVAGQATGGVPRRKDAKEIGAEMLQCHRCGVSLPPIQAMIGGDVSGQSLHWRMVNPCPGAAAHFGQTEMVPMCAKCDPTISTLSPSQNSVEQALRIDRLSRALQKIADLPTRSAKFGNVKGKGNPMLRAHRIAVSALRGLSE